MHLRFVSLGLLPFLMVVNGKIKMNYSRAFEAVVIALLTAFLTAYISVARIEVKIVEIEKKIDRVYDDFYKPMVNHMGKNK